MSSQPGPLTPVPLEPVDHPRPEGSLTTAALSGTTAHPIRGLSLDVGRKVFSVTWIERLLDRMGELGMTTLHLHLSDSGRVGVVLPGLEETAAPDALTRADIDQILTAADRNRVVVIPEIDLPGHATSLLAHRPELHLVDQTGRPDRDRLDIASVAGRQFAATVVDALLDLFPGPIIHLGGDEFFGAPWEDDEARHPDRFPGLVAWARQQTGDPTATAQDAYALHVTALAEQVIAAGRLPMLWSDHVVPASEHPVVPVPTTVLLDVWIRWREWTPSVTDLIDSGYRVLNSNGDHLYFVLSADGPIATTGRKSAAGITADFHPRRFMGLAGQGIDQDVPQVPDGTPDPVLGASMSVWCDAPEVLTPEQVWTQLEPWLVAFAGSFDRNRVGSD